MSQYPDEPAPADDVDHEVDDDAEFQPHQRARMHWLTRLLLVLAIFLAGFVMGVLADRALFS
jgi:hypothetical protein